MQERGVEPLHLAVQDPKSCASANSATPASTEEKGIRTIIVAGSNGGHRGKYVEKKKIPASPTLEAGTQSIHSPGLIRFTPAFPAVPTTRPRVFIASGRTSNPYPKKRDLLMRHFDKEFNGKTR
jgi:hypothetical protein